MSQWITAYRNIYKLLGYDQIDIIQVCVRNWEQRKELVNAYQIAIEQELITPIEKLDQRQKKTIWDTACQYGEFLQVSERIELSMVIHFKQSLL